MNQNIEDIEPDNSLPEGSLGQGVSAFVRHCAECVLFAIAGVVLLTLGAVILFLEKGETAGALAILLGGSCVILAPLLSRLEGNTRIGPIAFRLQRRVIRAVGRARTDTLEGIFPLLVSQQISIAKIPAPQRFESKRLKDRELQFLRQSLNLSVIAMLPPGSEQWLAGGEITERPIEPGTVLLIIGPRETLDFFKAVVAANTDEMWKRVL